MIFTSDPGKARSNLAKHGVTFEEATTVFDDPLASLLEDPDHSHDELRSILIGISVRQRLLFVVYTEEKGAIRLIGARRATVLERWQYECE